MEQVSVTLPGGRVVFVDRFSPVRRLLGEPEFRSLPFPVVAALLNNVPVALAELLDVDASLKLITLESDQGARIYRRTLCFLLAFAARRAIPGRRLVIGHSLGDSYFFHFSDAEEVAVDEIRLIERTMRELALRNLPITSKLLAYEAARAHFEGEHLDATSLLLGYRNDAKIAVYACEDFIDLSHGPLADSTGVLSIFGLERYANGCVLRYPRQNNPLELRPFEDNPLLFSVYQEYKRWGKILDVGCVGDLNRLGSSRQIQEFIRIAEALHNKRIAEIADRIAAREPQARAVFIAGPSSSGKTTFAKKLAIQLRVDGLKPVSISVDDYFVPREETPRGDDGEFDFESLAAIDVELFNRNLASLLRDGKSEVPAYDFKSGTRKTQGKQLAMGPRDVLVVEGIHCLNPELSRAIPRELKHLVYVSALTQLNLDDRNRVATTDNRLIRRLVRDYNFRGYAAVTTIARWPAVRTGEDRNIFPFQNNADSAFNSALDYELAVLKTYAEPLLRSVRPVDVEYAEAYRLLGFLSNFAPIPATLVPDDSILREFIGNSAFKY